MMWLDPETITFPHPSTANPDGILALGGDLHPDRLLFAYSYGIFPWYNAGEPIVWWHPNPRFVLFTDQLKVSKSMRPYFNQGKYRVTYDHDFPAVIANCSAAKRRGQYGTWITDDMRDAYNELHDLGFAHSVEVWTPEGDLVGGLYGILLGKIFFGESMFSRANNASKFGFISLVRELRAQGVELIDCQQKTPHLASLGGSSISRKRFLELLE
ncbi:MAG: leucyl/phenylalanyl-tRNA--protein transferase, partial [Bacteroidota bacterium]